MRKSAIKRENAHFENLSPANVTLQNWPCCEWMRIAALLNILGAALVSLNFPASDSLHRSAAMVCWGIDSTKITGLNKRSSIGRGNVHACVASASAKILRRNWTSSPGGLLWEHLAAGGQSLRAGSSCLLPLSGSSSSNSGNEKLQSCVLQLLILILCLFSF